MAVEKLCKANAQSWLKLNGRWQRCAALRMWLRVHVDAVSGPTISGASYRTRRHVAVVAHTSSHTMRQKSRLRLCPFPAFRFCVRLPVSQPEWCLGLADRACRRVGKCECVRACVGCLLGGFHGP